MSSVIDEIHTTAQQAGLSKEDVDAGGRIESQIVSLKSSMLNNAILEPIPHDGGSDIGGYNEELKALQNCTWLHSPWLYTECYLYRLIHTFFSRSTRFWQSFDMFGTIKRQSLVDSKSGVIELVKRFRVMLQVVRGREVGDDATQKTVFEEMMQISLWGNATDLSLLTSFSAEELNSRQGKAARESFKANVLVDDTERVWDLLSKPRSPNSSEILHIVLDNAGFELLTDLVFVGYLIEIGYTKKVILHGKRIPWFVSDVNPKDITYLIEGLSMGSIYGDVDSDDDVELREAGKYWQSLIDSGKMEFRTELFWTTQHSFGRMPLVELKLFSELSRADLVVFKGDLNYRKLTYDGVWPYDTAFSEALGPLARRHDGKGLRILALRTCKADVCVGLQSSQDKNLEHGWTTSGKYAVVSYWDAKS